MAYKLSYSKKFDKSFSKLDNEVQRRIFKWIEKNLEGTTEPRRYGKALSGNKKEYWRYRIGAYRIISEIEDDKILINLIDVGPRGDIYKQ